MLQAISKKLVKSNYKFMDGTPVQLETIRLNFNGSVHVEGDC